MELLLVHSEYFSKLTALGFGTTALPGMAIANPANHGYINYIVAHVIALAIGFVATAIIGKMWTTVNKAETIEEETNSQMTEKKQKQKMLWKVFSMHRQKVK